MPLIDAENTAESIIRAISDSTCCDCAGINDIIRNVISSAPTAESDNQGEWIINEADTAWTSHKCSACGKPAIYEKNREELYDEGWNGESEYCGLMTIGIIEHLTPYCPFCGAKIINYVEEQTNA